MARTWPRRVGIVRATWNLGREPGGILGEIGRE